MASEVTRAWIESEFLELSLFGNVDNFFIHQSQELPSEIVELLQMANISGRFVILSFEDDLMLWKKVIKQGKVNTLTIEPPHFWEYNKLLDFVTSYLRLPLSYEAKSWILESQESSLSSFYHSCYLIKLNYPEAQQIGLNEIKSLLTFEKLDQFNLASLLARKKNKDFYLKLMLLENDFEKMRGLFMFMQSHLIKMVDTSYLKQKTRLNQYDKDLQSTSKNWKTDELVKEIEKFNRWELLCKKKSTGLWNEIKQSYLRSQFIE
jgi:hypothetical protein